MKRHLVQTKDNSYTLFVPELDEHYHSVHGAVQESQHVFIQAGLVELAAQKKELSILEIGFGTGLNALLSCLSADKLDVAIQYTGLEKYPVKEEEWAKLDYASKLPTIYEPAPNEVLQLFESMHQAPWEAPVALSPRFELLKRQMDFQDFESSQSFDLIYYDAFAPSAQPELWTTALFTKMYAALKPKGLLTTYCVKGYVRRNMQASGFDVEKIPGPPGKREMARAWKGHNHS